jgi:hypothetical protein
VDAIRRDGNTCTNSRPSTRPRSGALGTGLGTALGVKLAQPGDTVVCVIGDGAFHYNPVPAALGFAQQYGVPILIVVCDNRGYTSQTWNVYKYFADGAAVRSGQFFGDVLTPTPDYVKLAEAYGGTGERVENATALEPAIDRALAALAAGPLAGELDPLPARPRTCRSRLEQRRGVPRDFLRLIVGSCPENFNGPVDGGLPIQGHEFTNGIPFRARREGDEPAVQSEIYAVARHATNLVLRELVDHDGCLNFIDCGLHGESPLRKSSGASRAAENLAWRPRSDGSGEPSYDRILICRLPAPIIR